MSARKNFDIRDYGAKALEGFANAPAVQKAVDAAAAAGGGRVVVPAGVWTSGTVWLKSHVELHLERGAVLLGSLRQEDYNRDDAFPENFWSVAEEWSGGHLILVYKAEDVSITGEGVIDGNGPGFFGEPDFDSWFPSYKYGLKLHPVDREWFRPGPMVAAFLSKSIRLEGVTLRNTPGWTAHFRCCDTLDICGVTVDADRTVANSDGFSIDCTRNVSVRDCQIKTGDDGFAIRASCALHAAERPCERIRVENCDVWSCCFGVRVGIGSGTIRDVAFTRCRFHEAGWAAVGFTPAWLKGEKNVYIEDCRFRDCEFLESARPVCASIGGINARLRDILFENCRFESLLPSFIGGDDVCAPENILFRNCTRRTLERVKVRQRRDWCGPASARRRFFELVGRTVNVRAEGCTPPDEEMGALVLSFDDRNFGDWLRAMPLFAKHGAHATFFVSGELDDEALRAMKALQEAGHTIGLHGLAHANAPEAFAERGGDRYMEEEIFTQTSACAVAFVRAAVFAYPNCRRTDETDEKFREAGFERLRGGLPLTPYDPDGTKQAGRRALATDDRAFFPASELPGRLRLDTLLAGEAYHTDMDDLCACVRRAAARKEVLVVTSHGISPGAGHIHMKTEWLERLLATAVEAGLPILGFDELPPVRQDGGGS